MSDTIMEPGHPLHFFFFFFFGLPSMTKKFRIHLLTFLEPHYPLGDIKPICQPWCSVGAASDWVQQANTCRAVPGCTASVSLGFSAGTEGRSITGQEETSLGKRSHWECRNITGEGISLGEEGISLGMWEYHWGGNITGQEEISLGKESLGMQEYHRGGNITGWGGNITGNVGISLGRREYYWEFRNITGEEGISQDEEGISLGMWE